MFIPKEKIQHRDDILFNVGEKKRRHDGQVYHGYRLEAA
jgi:hypothetical protein